MDMNSLMQMAGQFKERLDTTQAKAADMTVQGEAGGGLVQVTMNGRHEVTAVKIDPSVVQPGETALLEDLVRTAVNQASGAVGSGLQDQLGGLAKDFGVDLGAFAGMDLPR